MRINEKSADSAEEAYNKEEAYASEQELLKEAELRHFNALCRGYTLEKCRYCGYEIQRGEKKAQVYITGDIIHEECWGDYAEDNYPELCCVIDNDDDGMPEGYLKEDDI